MPITTVVVISRTGPLRRDHRGPQRMLGGTRLAECLALIRFHQPLQDQAADARLRFADFHPLDGKPLFGIELGIGRRQAIAALRNSADPPPLAIAYLKDLANQLERREIPLALHDPRVLVVDADLTLFEHAHAA